MPVLVKPPLVMCSLHFCHEWCNCSAFVWHVGVLCADAVLYSGWLRVSMCFAMSSGCLHMMPKFAFVVSDAAVVFQCCFEHFSVSVTVSLFLCDFFMTLCVSVCCHVLCYAGAVHTYVYVYIKYTLVIFMDFSLLLCSCYVTHVFVWCCVFCALFAWFCIFCTKNVIVLYVFQFSCIFCQNLNKFGPQLNFHLAWLTPTEPRLTPLRH